MKNTQKQMNLTQYEWISHLHTKESGSSEEKN